MTDVIMPQMGESIAEGTISLWLVDKGQYIEENQPLVTVSTDKADVDIPSPASGVLAEIIADVGTTVPVGKLIARIDESRQKTEAVKERAPAKAEAEKIPEAAGKKEGPAVPSKPVEGVPAAEAEKVIEPVTIKPEAGKAGTVAEAGTPAEGKAPSEHPLKPEGIPAAEAMKPPSPAEVVQPPPEIERPEPAEAVMDRSGFYSPAVMRLAVEHGIDLKGILGTGEGGRVTKSDVMRVISGKAEPAAKPLEAPALKSPEVPEAGKKGAVPPGPAEGALTQAAKPAPERAGPPEEAEAPEGIPEEAFKAAQETLLRGDEPEMVCLRKAMTGPDEGFGIYRPPVYEVEDGDTETSFSRLRRLIADHMVYSKRTSAHVTTFTEVDLDRVVGIRDENKDRIKIEVGISITFLPFVMLAAVRTLGEFPMMNSVVQGDKILTKRHIHLGVAVDSERGLMVPVIRQAEEMGLIDLAKSVAVLSDKVKRGKISPDELAGGTFTVSNPGRTGNLFGTPIISQPQVGILRMGEVIKRPVVIEVDGEDAIVIRPVMYLSLSYDHRVVDGYTANRFLHRIKEHLELGEFTV